MRILVLGVYYANNLGDAVICDCVAQRLKKTFPDAEVELRDLKARYSFQPLVEHLMPKLKQEYRRAFARHFVTSYLHWDKEKKHEEIRLNGSKEYIKQLCSEKWDAVVFAGGQLFQDGFILFLHEFVQYLEKQNVPVFFNACGTGPAWSPFVRNRLTETLMSQAVKLISTRDNRQLILKRYMKGCSKPVLQVSDPALWSGTIYGIEKQKNSQLLGLGVMYAPNVNIAKETKFWIRLIRYLNNKSVKWQIFINGGAEDLTYAKHLLEQLPEGEYRNMEIAVPSQPCELVSLIASYKSIISFRLHSHIIAASLGIPGAAIVWDEKLSFFYDKIGHPERCLTVQSKPEIVWKTLMLAEKQGIDSIEIDRQRIESELVLIHSLRRELHIS